MKGIHSFIRRISALRPGLGPPTMAVPLTQFLTSSKQNYLKDILANRGKEWTVVMGNEAGDLDTLASSIAYAYYLSTHKRTQSVALVQMDRTDLNLRAENTYALSLAGITDPASQLLFLSDMSSSALDPTVFPSNKFALVDHNKLDSRYESSSTVVTAIIDHHADEKQHLTADPRIITEAGSCSSLVTDYLFSTTAAGQDVNETKFETPTELATLLTCAMLIDTNGLKPKGKAQAADYVAAYRLLPRSSLAPEVDGRLPPSATGGDLTVDQQEQVHGIPALQELTSTLSAKKTDLSHLSTYDIIRRDFKEYTYEIPSFTTEGNGTTKAGLSTVPLPLEADWAEDGKLLNSALDWMARRDLSILGILTTFRAKKPGNKKGKHEREGAWIVQSKSSESLTFLADKLFAGLEADGDLQLKEHDKVHIDVGQKQDVRAKVYKQKNADVTRKGVAPLLALGSNLGDRFRNIELALRLLEEHPGKNATVDIVDTSFLYETAPMYVTDQPAFINCACIIQTDLEPVDLLASLKTIENQVGRVPSQRFGPRAVDLDIIFYDDLAIDTRPQQERERLDNLIGQLVIPHPRLPEREFVLRPLNDIIPDYQHPVLKKTVKTLLSDFSTNPDCQPMLKVIPFPRHPDKSLENISGLQVPGTLTYWTHPQRTERRKSATVASPQTQIMAIINVTPDSFSDGAQYGSVPTALEHASSAVVEGASVLDIGGYSTRPGADFVSVQQEIARVQPVVEAIRCSDDEKLKNTIISVDTFRPEVAEVAILSGANCINDVHAFTGPEWWKGGQFGDQATSEVEEYMRRMKEVAKKYAVPVILMHSRGDAGKNKKYDMYSYAEETVVEGVRIELGEKVERVVKGKGGLRRWMVIVDIGIGFSKTVEGNLELLRSASKVTELTEQNPLAGFPQLIGASRKSFLGILLAEGDHGRKTEPKERTWATAATVACSVQQGALAVRVHDVKEMADVVRVSDAIWGCTQKHNGNHMDRAKIFHSTGVA